MTELIRSFTEPHDLEEIYGVVAVDDADGELGLAEPSAWEIGPPAQGEWLDAGPNGITLKPSGRGSVYVRYELWSGPPPTDLPAEAWSGTILITSGKISALSGGYGDDDDLHTVFDLGRPDMVWNVQVGRRTLENDVEPDFPRHAYHTDLFRLQFWPTAL
ncbi:hypothetical protein [Nonomuraea sp. NPDC049028]|uniref:hypothetical protein n=1 Tax=Nonomuraea sp. NPDC049028 TaxID=3364348 RepID=UPI00371A0B1A